MRKWSSSSSGGFVPARTRPFASDLPTCSCARFTTISIIGARQTRSRLALIIVLHQFSRSVFRNTARAFAQDPKALNLTLEGIEIGHYAALETPWEKTFFFMPLGHSEDFS